MNYDFDIHWIMPRAMFDDPKLGPALHGAGLAPNARGNYRALFRDAATRDALKAAPAGVRAVLEGAGFGYSVHRSGAPDGFYPAEDEAAQLDVLARLSEGLGDAGQEPTVPGGFDLGAFLAHAASLRPVTAKGRARARGMRMRERVLVFGIGMGIALFLMGAEDRASLMSAVERMVTGTWG